jgi:hypothetical protein
VLGRLARRAKGVLGAAARAASGLCRDRPRSAKRLARRIGAAAQRRAAYRRLLVVAKASLRQAEQGRRALAETTGAAAERLRAAFGRFEPLVWRRGAQAERRVLQGGRPSRPARRWAACASRPPP